MRTLRTTLLGTAVVAGLVSGAYGQISNSDHNFSSYAWSGGEICKPCHTPHGANAAAGALWNHELTTQTYTMFGGATGTAAADFDKVSRLCLSCHDGSVALDSFGGKTGTSFIPTKANIGTDLQNDHPIGSAAIYTTSASTSFNAQDASHKVISAAGSLSLRAWVNPSGTTQYVVGCKTCHDPHNKGGYDHMLRFANTASQLCLTCHIK